MYSGVCTKILRSYKCYGSTRSYSCERAFSRGNKRSYICVNVLHSYYPPTLCTAITSAYTISMRYRPLKKHRSDVQHYRRSTRQRRKQTSQKKYMYIYILVVCHRLAHRVGLCASLCLRTGLMYDVYDCIESTEMVEYNY